MSQPIAVVLVVLAGTLTMIPEEYATWEQVYAAHVSYGHIEPDLVADVYLASWPEYLGYRFQLQCPSGAVFDALVVDVASERDLPYLHSIGFAADIFGREAWERCVIPGKTAQVTLAVPASIQPH